MSEAILILAIVFMLMISIVLILTLRNNQKFQEVWKGEVSNLRLEFMQQLQGTVQNINSQIQNVTNQVNATTIQLNQKLDNSISYLSTHVNQAVSQMIGAVMSNLQNVTEQVGQSTGLVNQRLDNAAKIISELQKRIGELSEKSESIKTIGQSIARLEDLFKAQQFRGGFGEIMLEKMIQDILPKEYYQFQYQFKNGKRVDAIVKMNDRILPIDSKFPLDNYKKMIEAKDENERKKMKAEFVKDVKKRTDEIAQSYIQPDENTFDFAMMYIPSEAIYYEIITDDESMDYMLKKRVVPVSPSVLYAQLTVFGIGFKTIQFEKNIRQIIDSLSKLVSEFDGISREFDTLGKHINNAQTKYAEIDKKLSQFGSSFRQLAGQGSIPD
ncbi:DNA recombination protein RmuC [Candidatus Chrysopegis kryptomonas]|uniref:DNA recombination protein RmuC n=1 Tax=Candidatus Chryseopegocella kryptomonas TaxID=1633643 RepID=A0A0P1MSG7_9BACT|nr:DNA recombination protein RmuC [Candidatus Chrysopegis kryptomonas]CUS98706.1 DNA recombination protein RmuC [Candidatus Chrysopegis kryptomonas]